MLVPVAHSTVAVVGADDANQFQFLEQIQKQPGQACECANEDAARLLGSIFLHHVLRHRQQPPEEPKSSLGIIPDSFEGGSYDGFHGIEEHFIEVEVGAVHA